MNKHEITIDVDEWHKDGEGLLRAVIHVNGCGVHLEAHEVGTEPCEGGELQVGVGEDSCFSELNLAFEVNGVQQTIEIEGRAYVLFAHGFGE